MTLDTATLATVAYTFGITLMLNLTLLCLLLNRPRPLVMWSIAFLGADSGLDAGEPAWRGGHRSGDAAPV